MKIELSGYNKFLAEIQNHLKLAQSEIINTVTRQKVVMSWQIGQSINRHLQKNNRAEYGKKLIDQLAQDTAISRSALYQMRSFYQTYPKLPKDDGNLNWSHYRSLSGVKEKSQREYFTNLAQQQNWDVKTLEQEIKNVEVGARRAVPLRNPSPQLSKSPNSEKNIPTKNPPPPPAKSTPTKPTSSASSTATPFTLFSI